MAATLTPATSFIAKIRNLLNLHRKGGFGVHNFGISKIRRWMRLSFSVRSRAWGPYWQRLVLFLGGLQLQLDYGPRFLENFQFFFLGVRSLSIFSIFFAQTSKSRMTPRWRRPRISTKNLTDAWRWSNGRHLILEVFF